MFRYGGPIKEGVMSGIREPKKNGGSMSQLVKPNNDGSRPGYAGPALLALPYIGAGIRLAARPFGQFIAKQVAKRGVTAGSGAGTIRSGLGTSRVLKPGESLTTTKEVFNPNALGSYFARSPEGRLLAGSTGFAGKVGRGIYKVGKGAAKSPLTMGALAWTGYQWVKPDGTPANENEIAQAKANTGAPPGGGDPGMRGDGSFFAEQAEKEALAKKQKALNNRIKRYRDIMDIKGMNKQAAYKSLIDASKLIQESQDFKGDIKSGKLINQVIQAASKQFDKPVKTSDAVNTLILQNELKKDLSAETDALAKEKTLKQIAVYNKQLKGDSTSEVIQAIALRTGMPQGDQLNQLVSLNNPELNLKTIPTQDMGQKDPITYIAEIVSSVNNDPSTPNYPAGNYVIKDKVVQITEEGNITPIPINQLK